MAVAECRMVNTVNVKYQIFLSSTFEDLKAERDQVAKAILEMGHIPVGMEMFSAADEEQWEIIARHIRESDYHVVVVAHRYGSTTADGLSFTEREYDFAVQSGVPVLGFVLDDSAPWPADRSEKDSAKRIRLDAFKVKIQSRYISKWKSSEDLYSRVAIALAKQIAARPRVGWVRADRAAEPEVLSELARLSKENAELRARSKGLSPDLEAGAWSAFLDAVHQTVHARRNHMFQNAPVLQQALSKLEIAIVGGLTESLWQEAQAVAKTANGDDFSDNAVAALRAQIARLLRSEATDRTLNDSSAPHTS